MRPAYCPTRSSNTNRDAVYSDIGQSPRFGDTIIDFKWCVADNKIYIYNKNKNKNMNMNMNMNKKKKMIKTSIFGKLQRYWVYLFEFFLFVLFLKCKC